MDGLWSFRVTGIETRPGGEPFTFIARSENDTSAVAPVPLPAAGWLLVGALGALAATRRRKPAAAAAS